MTAWITGHDDRFKAAAPQRGVYNLVSFWSVTDITQFIKDEMGAFPWEDLNQLWEQSPIAYVDKTKTPTRIIHSENDFRVPIEQAEEYYASLLKLGVPAELVRYPEEGHELSRSGKPKHMKDLGEIYEKLTQFPSESIMVLWQGKRSFSQLLSLGGRYSLHIYMLHQPLFLGILYIISQIISE